jgi:putative endonuclease
MSDNLILGKFGEQMAKELLVEKGFRILESNFRTRYGEIDIIAQKDRVLAFVEVKTRIGTRFGMPYQAVNYRKLSHLKKASQYYLILNPYPNLIYRTDVVSIVLKQNNDVQSIEHFEGVVL